jgi:hypothetical protein
MLEHAKFGRREVPVPAPVVRSFFDPLEEFCSQGPTGQQLALAQLNFIIVDTSRPGYRWRDQSQPFAVLSGGQSYGCYATEREALARVLELKNP